MYKTKCFFIQSLILFCNYFLILQYLNNERLIEIISTNMQPMMILLNLQIYIYDTKKKNFQISYRGGQFQ